LRNIACCATWLTVYGADWLDREWANLCCAKEYCATWLIVYGPHYKLSFILLNKEDRLKRVTRYHKKCFMFEEERANKLHPCRWWWWWWWWWWRMELYEYFHTLITQSIHAWRPGNRGSIPGKDRDFASFHCIQTRSGPHPISYLLAGGLVYASTTKKITFLRNVAGIYQTSWHHISKDINS
jgi:hypothetical protein